MIKPLLFGREEWQQEEGPSSVCQESGISSLMSMYSPRRMRCTSLGGINARPGTEECGGLLLAGCAGAAGVPGSGVEGGVVVAGVTDVFPGAEDKENVGMKEGAGG